MSEWNLKLGDQARALSDAEDALEIYQMLQSPKEVKAPKLFGSRSCKCAPLANPSANQWGVPGGLWAGSGSEGELNGFRRLPASKLSFIVRGAWELPCWSEGGLQKQ